MCSAVQDVEKVCCQEKVHFSRELFSCVMKNSAFAGKYEDGTIINGILSI